MRGSRLLTVMRPEKWVVARDWLSWRKIPIALIDQRSKRVMAWLQQPSFCLPVCESHFTGTPLILSVYTSSISSFRVQYAVEPALISTRLHLGSEVPSLTKMS
jgi:hypothetical protein